VYTAAPPRRLLATNGRVPGVAACKPEDRFTQISPDSQRAAATLGLNQFNRLGGLLKLKLIAAAAAALTLAGTAAAQVTTGIHVSTKKHHVNATFVRHHGGNLVGGAFLAAASTYLQLDKATIVAGLKSGQSLAQIATAHGKTADGLVTALLAPAKLKLDAAVAAGKLTSDREAALLAKLQTALTNLVNKTATPKTRPVHVDPAAILKPALSYLKLDLKSVVTQLQSGKTLAQIAVAQGGTAQGLIDAVVASVKTKLDAQVSAGRITAAQESAFLATLQTSVAKFVNG
jgi:hypothetical protein